MKPALQFPTEFVLCKRSFGNVPDFLAHIIGPSGIVKQGRNWGSPRFLQPNLIPDGTTTISGWYGLFFVSSD